VLSDNISHFLSNGFSSSSPQSPPSSINGCGVVTKGRHTCLAKKVPEDKYEIMWSAYPYVAASFIHDGMLSFFDDTCTWESDTVVMSSSPEEEDCVVAVKILGPQLSFFRPAQSNFEGWTNVRIANPCFYSSQVIFSKRDGMFRISGSGGHIIGSWDLQRHKQKNHRLRLQNLPERTKTQRELLESCSTSVFLLQLQPTNETFLVKWYKKTSGKIMKTKGVMVFKVDHKGTQDI